MRTFSHFVKPILLVTFCVTLSLAYPPVFAESPEPQADAHHAQETMDWPGIYQGFTPCANCMGIKTQLALNSNHSSYVMITQNVGNSVREYVEKGKFSWDSQSKTITLTPRKSTKTQQYLVGDNTLTQLDSTGKLITGELAERYILRRNDVTKPQDTHAGH